MLLLHLLVLPIRIVSSRVWMSLHVCLHLSFHNLLLVLCLGVLMWSISRKIFREGQIARERIEGVLDGSVDKLLVVVSVEGVGHGWGWI